jgi:FlaA1/EpsC-like NDP-sugar epimerase
MQMNNRIFIKKLFSVYLRLASRRRYVVLLDIFVLLFAIYISYAIRYSLRLDPVHAKIVFQVALLYPLCIVSMLLLGGTYKFVWPKGSIEEYLIFSRWYAFGAILFALIVNFSSAFSPLTRTSQVMTLLIGITFLTAQRAAWKLAYVTRNQPGELTKRAIIIGAGEAGTLLARDLIRNSFDIRPVGFIDDNPDLRGMNVASLKVLGNSDELRKIVIDEGAEIALIATPSAPGGQIKKFVAALEGLNIEVRILPSLLDLADGNISVNRLRSVSLEDLLRREPVNINDPETQTYLKGKVVLVTGAGGSIGSEICRQVLKNGPKELLVLGHGEQSIYQLLESFSKSGNKIPIRPIIADIADTLAVMSIFEKYSPQVVFHAAAHKHVPLMEDNPREALRVNSFGAWNLTTLAGRNGVERMVMISTDKAVHPTSVMGATKRIAERLLFFVQQKYPQTSFMAVRFGNVLGSRGSVVPKFEDQILHGGPVTVTHKDMKRYFMLIPEAVSLVLQTGSTGSGGELFVLDMGEPVNITEMAETLIRLHGFEPYKDIKIEFSGIRPGEKLYEELFYDPAHVAETGKDKIFLGRLAAEKQSIIPEVERLLKESASGLINEQELKAGIFALGSSGEEPARESGENVPLLASDRQAVGN